MLRSREYQTHDAQMKPEAKYEHCLQCSVCGLVCVVNHAEVYEPRHTFVYDLFNEGIEARETLWGCPSCHKCEERCPYEFKPLELVKGLKAAAFEAGLAPREVYGEFEIVINTGSAFPTGAATERQRDKLGLSGLPEKPVDELQVIADRTGLTARLAAVRKAQQSEESSE
ncbi:MAG: 4Fe-4S dicluster domain-containing protein [Anaerolineaceae bacterium]|jgi:heterodisulfide reductase subunit C|nr:4Fe-4S dicluster domain-containing protein [Anaerolineaceae bacterium]